MPCNRLTTVAPATRRERPATASATRLEEMRNRPTLLLRQLLDALPQLAVKPDSGGMLQLLLHGELRFHSSERIAARLPERNALAIREMQCGARSFRTRYSASDEIGDHHGRSSRSRSGINWGRGPTRTS
jgi:hypothetical protein